MRRLCLKPFFWIYGRHISASSPYRQKWDTLVMQNNTRLPQWLLLRCSKTTTSEPFIDQRVVLNEHVWAEVDRRRKSQRDNVHIEAGGVHCWNKPKIPSEVCNEEQMLGSYSSKTWAHPLKTICSKMVLLIFENEFLHLEAIN